MGKSIILEAFDAFEVRIQVGSNFPRYVEHLVQFQRFLKGVLKVPHDIMTRMTFSLASCQFIQSMHSMGWVVGWQGRHFSGYAPKRLFDTNMQMVIEIGDRVRRRIVEEGLTLP